MTMNEHKIIVAIDGHSSCGKSTMARELASSVGYVYIDTGAMYRAVTLLALREGLISDTGVDAIALEALLAGARINFRFNPAVGYGEIYLGDECVEAEIRTMRVASVVSQVAAIPAVREAMAELQRQMGQSKGIVMDGRDIGTNVFPDAELKVFVTASPEVRAERRLLELRGKGDESTTLEEVLTNLKERDHQDSTRAVAPLIQAPDALLLDNTSLTRQEQKERLRAYFDQAIANLKA